jgi:hypothetical protein
MLRWWINFVGCYVALIGKLLLVFQRILAPSSLWYSSSYRIGAKEEKSVSITYKIFMKKRNKEISTRHPYRPYLLMYPFILNMKAKWPYEKFVFIYQSARGNIQEDLSLKNAVVRASNLVIPRHLRRV